MSAQPQSPQDEGESEFSINWLDDGAVFTITRMRKLNALTKPVLNGLAACLDRLETEGKTLLVVTGKGDRAFCAGTDLAEMQSMTPDAVLDKSAMARDLLVRLSRSRLISVAAVNGLALGGGMELAMACTLRIAVPHARFGLPEVKLGLLPAYAGTQFLPAIVGASRALEIMLTGRDISLDEALVIGLAHRVTEPEENLVEAGIGFAREITQHSPTAIAAIRECLTAASTTVEDKGLAVEDRLVRAVFPGPEAKAGVAAFLGRKKT
ncbi:enoyl-CoA hydratase/isomerase family protein [Sphingobium aquiterrae]|uniref:enoyl-CoA hydratase/isomerase family protein n=1 Tax=Sphingobium aquiterrae TaxID=2038656 RepID=UPI003019705D